MSRNSTLSIEMFHVKCMVGWQELSLHRKASRGSLDPYTENGPVEGVHSQGIVSPGSP